jgi:arylsulfatase A-like enzyme
LQASEKYLSRYGNIEDEKRRTYAAMVSAVDDGVGAILSKLEALNIEDNTLVFFLSDNGGPESHNASDNGKLRAGKGSLYEGGVRVPFVVKWPNVIPQNMLYDYPVISLDIFATAIANAGVESKNSIDGVNLVPFLTGEKGGYPHEQLLWRNYDAGAYAIRFKNFKLVQSKTGDMGMFDLSKDIGEQYKIKDSSSIHKFQQYHQSWNRLNMKPIFEGLMQNNEYTKTHPDRFKNVEPY